MNIVLCVILAIAALISAPGPTHADPAKPQSPTASEVFDHEHKLYRDVLQNFLVVEERKSQVDYRALKAAPEILNRYLAQIESLPAAAFEQFTRDQQLAFLLNAYNAFTLKWIITHYPVSSIKRTVRWYQNPWKQEFFQLFGVRRHLDYIEHEVIRKEFDEPRIHFALVCAARSCPRLQPEPYLATKLDQQLEEAASNFLQDPDRNRYDAKSGMLWLSKIFDWYGSDFDSKYGSALEYVAPRIPNLPEDAVQRAVPVKYLEYDWDLNDA